MKWSSKIARDLLPSSYIVEPARITVRASGLVAASHTSNKCKTVCLCTSRRQLTW